MPYRVSYAQRINIQEQFREMTDQEIIRLSSSSWSFPVVLVKKKDSQEKLRFCVDFWEINKLSSRPMRPLPRVEDAANSFGDAHCFISLDFNSGFGKFEWQKKIFLDVHV